MCIRDSYDYYQPEAYVPQTNTFIEKDSSVNAEVERLRHSTTNALLSRRDVVVVSTVSCIYGLGKPEEYYEAMVPLAVGDRLDRDVLLRRFVDMQYQRNDIEFVRGNFRVRGDTVEILSLIHIWVRFPRASPCSILRGCRSREASMRSFNHRPCIAVWCETRWLCCSRLLRHP